MKRRNKPRPKRTKKQDVPPEIVQHLGKLLLDALTTGEAWYLDFLRAFMNDPEEFWLRNCEGKIAGFAIPDNLQLATGKN